MPPAHAYRHFVLASELPASTRGYLSSAWKEVRHMAQTQPTNEQIVKLLQRVLDEMSELRAELAKLTKVV